MMFDFSRRKFIKKSSALIASQLILSHAFAKSSNLEMNLNGKAKILELRLDTNADIQLLKNFYVDILGMKLISMDKYQCKIKAGSSSIQFTKINAKVDAPFYHFAFNISHNKIQHAEEWLSSRTELIEAPKKLRENKIESKCIVSFDHWNAHSLFFYDPAGNVVEFIARHNLANSNIGKFTNEDIICISEIGLVVDEIEPVYEDLAMQLGLNKYGPSSNEFLALGDEEGLILLFRKDSKAVFGKGRNRRIYNTGIILDKRDQDFECLLSSYPYYICA